MPLSSRDFSTISLIMCDAPEIHLSGGCEVPDGRDVIMVVVVPVPEEEAALLQDEGRHDRHSVLVPRADAAVRDGRGRLGDFNLQLVSSIGNLDGSTWLFPSVW